MNAKTFSPAGLEPGRSTDDDSAMREPAATREPSIPPLPASIPKDVTRILLADDDTTIRSLGGLLLVSCGYEVDTVADGAEAWAALQNKPYQLLVTDNEMPRLSGLELIDRVHLTQMDLPIVLASSTVYGLSVHELRSLQGVTLLAKPFTSAELLTAVRRTLQPDPGAQPLPETAFPLANESHHNLHLYPRWGINE